MKYLFFISALIFSFGAKAAQLDGSTIITPSIGEIEKISILESCSVSACTPESLSADSIGISDAPGCLKYSDALYAESWVCRNLVYHVDYVEQMGYRTRVDYYRGCLECDEDAGWVRSTQTIRCDDACVETDLSLDNPRCFSARATCSCSACTDCVATLFGSYAYVSNVPGLQIKQTCGTCDTSTCTSSSVATQFRCAPGYYRGPWKEATNAWQYDTSYWGNPFYGIKVVLRKATTSTNDSGIITTNYEVNIVGSDGQPVSESTYASLVDSICRPCPEITTISPNGTPSTTATTSVAGSDAATDCYVPTSTTVTDTVGTWRPSAICEYTSAS